MKINRKKYIYTGGIILLIIIITTRYLDTLYYFNKANIRYTIGVYFKSGYYKGIIHQFKYRVADFDYIVDTEKQMKRMLENMNKRNSMLS